ncbi:MAG: hypothetical protein KJ061_02265 [Vicinamibacteraceae bacterium]|nr:hypothetical protein [Vicinamibacteraceae bacterium]
MNLLQLSIARVSLVLSSIGGRARREATISDLDAPRGARAGRTPRPHEAALRWLEYYGLASGSRRLAP